MKKYILISENGTKFPASEKLIKELYKQLYAYINKIPFESYICKLMENGVLKENVISDFYLYRNQETNLLEVLAINKLLALFNISDDRENGSNFSDYIQDNIKAGLIQPFNISNKMDLYIYELPALYKEYILQECEKVFNGISWINTDDELKKVECEKLTNLTDTIDIQKYL